MDLEVGVVLGCDAEGLRQLNQLGFYSYLRGAPFGENCLERIGCLT